MVEVPCIRKYYEIRAIETLLRTCLDVPTPPLPLVRMGYAFARPPPSFVRAYQMNDFLAA